MGSKFNRRKALPARITETPKAARAIPGIASARLERQRYLPALPDHSDFDFELNSDYTEHTSKSEEEPGTIRNSSSQGNSAGASPHAVSGKYFFRKENYLSSTLAPEASIFFLSSSASSLGNAFLDGLGSAFDEVLGFLEAEAGHFADNLDDADLVGTDFLEDNVEFGLFFSGRGSNTTGRRGRRRQQQP